MAEKKAGQATTGKTGQRIKNTGRQRMLDGKVVKPFLYDGNAVGHGKYYGGYIPDLSKKDETVWDAAVLDEQGLPVQFRQIGTLV